MKTGCIVTINGRGKYDHALFSDCKKDCIAQMYSLEL